MEVSIVFNGVKLTVLGQYEPAQDGGLDDPSWGEWFSFDKVQAGGVDISELLSDAQLEAVSELALEAYNDR